MTKLELGHVEFSGLRYGSDCDGAAVTVAEAENAASGQFDHDTLDAIAEVAAYKNQGVGTPSRAGSGKPEPALPVFAVAAECAARLAAAAPLACAR